MIFQLRVKNFVQNLLGHVRDDLSQQNGPKMTGARSVYY